MFRISHTLLHTLFKTTTKTPQRWRQEEGELIPGSLGYIARPCLKQKSPKLQAIMESKFHS
jgi:hypothetical protein